MRLSSSVRAAVGRVMLAVAALGASPWATQAPAVDISLFREMAWRPLGPFRGGRTTAAAGIPTQPNVFFAGTADGGVWKTTDAGRVWRPIFDNQPTASIGSIAIAASDPNVMYVGSGEAPLSRDAATGDGLYRSADAGRTWTRLGLGDSRHIPAVLVDPRTPDRVFVAAAGSSFGRGQERGVFRSTDGGRSFERVLYANDDTGALDLAFDPIDPSIVYATLFQSRHSAWGGTRFHGPSTSVHKSVDGGTTWRESGRGLPTFAADRLRSIRLAVAPTDRQRLFAAVDAERRSGLYRSDDQATTWTLVSTGGTPSVGDQDVAGVAVDPVNADVVYLLGARALRSTDGGRTFIVWRSDPAGGSFGSLWVNPSAPGMAMLAGDRGAVITVNGGETWSSGHNQPTGQFARVATDAAFPYRVCGAERGSPPGCLPSRGQGGRIALGDWRTVGTTPDGSVAPDPQDPDVVYVGALGRFDGRTGQVQDYRPPLTLADRVNPSAPLVFARDGRTLYYGTTVVWKTVIPGSNWTAVSPDLSRETWDIPVSVGSYRAAADADPKPRGAISALAPSPIDGRAIWAGTTDGLVHVTRDAGVTWLNVSPPQLEPWARVSSIEASHFDTSTAYVAVDGTALDDRQPRLWRTRDGGVSWIAITAGLPGDAVVNAVREDSLRRGLLFAATSRSVFLSFDDGDRWQPLRINLPAVGITDLALKDADLVAATNGRGFWVLDDISAFRQITADVLRADVFLFRPPMAWRSAPMMTPDAVLHRDEPAATNPPDGVPISFLVGPGAGPTTIEIIETVTGEVVRRFSSEAAEDEGGPSDGTPRLTVTPGLHRVIWDLKYAPVDGRGMWVMPGTYQVRMTTGARVSRQAVIVRMDPRVRTAATDLTAQFKLSRAIEERRRAVATARARLSGPAAATSRATLQGAADELARVLDMVQQSDTRPTAAAEAATAAAFERARAALTTAGLP